MKITTLAIETSCDDTSVAIISFDGDNFVVEKIVAYSQIKDHQKYGGVVPEIASRMHSEKIVEVLAEIGWDDIADVDFICLTTHPGLPGSLVVGRATATLLAEYFDKELVPVNHIHWHIFSLFLERNVHEIKFPMMILTASGWHNDIYFVEKLNYWNTIKFEDFKITRIGKSIDDASWEAFDKVSRMLWWPYPGGPWISKMAKWHSSDKINLNIKGLEKFWTGKLFTRTRLDKEKYDFSFSGIKSQVYNFLKKLERNDIKITDEIIKTTAYEFQEAVIEMLTTKLLNASQNYKVKTVAICGWVSANKRRWIEVEKKCKNFDTIKPTKIVYSTDNAAMIGVVWIMSRK